ncbi:MAG: ATP-binding protein [Candidatus Zixiibacteriota bacterium]
MRNLSLKWQIFLLVLMAVTVVVVTLTLLTIVQVRSHLRRSLDENAISTSRLLADNIGPGLEFNDSVYVAEIATTAIGNSNVVGISIYDTDRRQVFRSAGYNREAPIPDSCNFVNSLEITRRGPLCLIERPVTVKGRTVGCLWLVVSEEAMLVQLRKSMGIALSVAACLFVLTGVIGIVVSRRVVQPIKTFEQAAARISSGDMKSVIDLAPLHRDFVSLGSSFNNMQAALGRAFGEISQARDQSESLVQERTRALQEELAERKRAEKALEEGRELLRATIESTADGILVVDSQGWATHSNKRFADMWHIPDELLATRDDNRLLAHVLDQLVDAPAFLGKVRELYDSRDESTDILNFRDGRVFERYSCPLIQNGTLAGRVWSFRDITERIRATEHMQFTQFTVDHAAESAFWMRQDARFFYVNEAACQSLGYSRQELLAKSIHDIDPNFPTEAWPIHWSELRRKGSLTFQSSFRRKDGREYPVEITANYVEFGGKAYNCAFARDITDRRRTEQAHTILMKVAEAANQTDSLESLLKTVQHQLGGLIDTKNFYVALWDSERQLYTFPYSHDEHPDEDYSPQRLDGSLTDYVRKHGVQLLVDDRQQRLLDERGEIRSAGTPAAAWMGVPLRTATGTIGVLAVQNYHDPEAYSDADLDWLMSIADPIARVIERKGADEQQRHLREELDRAERMKSIGVLAGGVAHDLNNMLGPLVGYPELILLKLPQDSPIRKHVQRIGTAANEAASVVQDLLTLARRGRYEMVPIDLNAVVEGYLDTPGFAKLRETRGSVTFSAGLDPGIGKIMGSAPHLSKVIMNLVVNAFDAMPHGGSLTISTRRQHLDRLLSGYEDVQHGDYAVLSVQDTGTGIDPADIDKIFEPYYSKKKMGSSGSGLGLSVVYGVVKDHNGYYDVISEVGKGTEFIMYLPITAVGEEARKECAPEIRGAERVLVVDDDDNQREMASELLGSLGYLVACAANGHEALAVLRRESFDIVVLDMIMEKDFDGLDTYREIIQFRQGQKVIVVSGFSSTERVEEMQKLGAGQYVKKPYTLQTLGAAIRTELARPVAIPTNEVFEGGRPPVCPNR